MHEILDDLSDDAFVLDIGCGEGSFRAERYEFKTIRADLIAPKTCSPLFVQADAARLPFQSRTFDAIVLNHCIEHFVALKPTLQEIGRVVKRDGAVFVSVPDARTITDRIYRKVTKNAGGHVNLFGSSAELEKMLGWYLGLPHVATRILHSGLSFLNRTNLNRHPEIRMQMRFGGIWEPALAGINAALRLLDSLFHTRLTVYGWAMYFGSLHETVNVKPMPNVCLRCGNGQPFAEIRQNPRGRRNQLLTFYACSVCGARNIAIAD